MKSTEELMRLSKQMEEIRQQIDLTEVANVMFAKLSEIEPVYNLYLQLLRDEDDYMADEMESWLSDIKENVEGYASIRTADLKKGQDDWLTR